MGRKRIWRGKMVQGDTPNWEPLLDLVGESVTGDFMWMFEVELEDGTRLQAYKHVDTRGYVHLDSEGRAFVYEDPDRYRGFAVDRVLATVFAGLPWLAGVTGDQVAASWAVVEKLRNEAS